MLWSCNQIERLKRVSGVSAQPKTATIIHKHRPKNTVKSYFRLINRQNKAWLKYSEQVHKVFRGNYVSERLIKESRAVKMNKVYLAMRVCERAVERTEERTFALTQPCHNSTKQFRRKKTRKTRITLSSS